MRPALNSSCPRKPALAKAGAGTQASGTGFSRVGITWPASSECPHPTQAVRGWAICDLRNGRSAPFGAGGFAPTPDVPGRVRVTRIRMLARNSDSHSDRWYRWKPDIRIGLQTAAWPDFLAAGGWRGGDWMVCTSKARHVRRSDGGRAPVGTVATLNGRDRGDGWGCVQQRRLPLTRRCRCS
jgi:hypothetical protein